MSLGLLLTAMKNSVDLNYTRYPAGNHRRWGSQRQSHTENNTITESEIADGLAERDKKAKKIGRDARESKIPMASLEPSAKSVRDEANWPFFNCLVSISAPSVSIWLWPDLSFPN